MLEDDIYKLIIKDHVAGKSGIYALYHNEQLKYVGLASNLPSRLAQHLKDQHADSWNRFSMYLTVDDTHMHDLETLILRIADPSENKTKGNFTKSENLKSKITKEVKEKFRHKQWELLGGQINNKEKSNKPTKEKPISVASNQQNEAYPLGKYISHRFMINLIWNGKTFKAWVTKKGQINFNSKIFSTPTAAAKEVTGAKAINGWVHWKYKNEEREWVSLDKLRHGKKKKKNVTNAIQNTIVCPAKEEGFQEEFIGNHCWWAIRLSKNRLTSIRYIALYRVSPVSAITHHAKVIKIEPYKNTGKYIVFFEKPKKFLIPIPLIKGQKNPIQSPIFTSWEKLKKAKSISDL